MYDLMNWPEIEAVVYSECDAPYSLLGGMMCKDGFLVQAFRPDAVEMAVQIEGKKKSYIMEKVDEAGYFAVIIPVKKRVKYTLTVEDIRGKKVTYIDPYEYEVTIAEEDLKRFDAGVCRDAYKFMGSHSMTVAGVEGMHFSVWAPNAMRVSVIGEFNNWDGRIFQMNRSTDSGVFELFVPGLKQGMEYAYEIKFKNGLISKKLDPYACEVKKGDMYTSVMDIKPDYNWSDEKWLKARDSKGDNRDQALSICEILPSDCSKDIVSKVKELKFNYVKLPACFATADGVDGKETISYYGVNSHFKNAEELQGLINEFHNNDIGVLVDWNAAYMSQAQPGIAYYDGSALYEASQVKLHNHPELNVSTFDYTKPQVKSFLYSNFSYLLNKFHVDGVVIDEVASVLYLDYGKHAGEWIPNIYGGNENLAAIEFIKGLRKLISKHGGRPLLVAEESSAWPMVTGDITADGLGFDYKLNDGWKKEVIPFLKMDPLFRKGIYDKLTYSMLYQYTEDFILDYSYVNGVAMEKLCDMVPGCSTDEDEAALNKAYGTKAALSFMYMHPGKKMLNIRDCEDAKGLVANLNQFYKDNAALYEQDGVSDGFEWVDTQSAEETVYAFVRRAADGTELFVAVNFTPVVRENYRIGVTRPGKYTEVFNSNAALVKPKRVKTTDVAYWSEDVGCNYRDNSVAVNLPALGVAVYAYEPFTDIELKEIQIRKEAAIAKKKAEEEARQAEELMRQAQMRAEDARRRAEDAKRAEEAASMAAKEALEAQKKAEAIANKAEKASQKIDEQTKKKLEALNKDKK